LLIVFAFAGDSTTTMFMKSLANSDLDGAGDRRGARVGRNMGNAASPVKSMRVAQGKSEAC
jgi:hypothetical protein